MRQRKRRKLNPRFVALCLAVVFLSAAVIVTLMGKLAGGDAPVPAEVEKHTPDYVQEAFLTENEWSRPGDKLEKVDGVVIHYVGNPGTSAQANRNYFESLSTGADGVYASSHFIVGLEGEVLQCVPLDEIAYASNIRNEDTVSVETCHPDETGAYTPATYDRCVELTAWLCHEFRLNPETDVIRHYDVTGKLCPLYFVENEDAWETFKADVAASLAELEAADRQEAKA